MTGKPMEGLEVQFQSRRGKHYKNPHGLIIDCGVDLNRRAASAIVAIVVIMNAFSFMLMTFSGNVRASTLFVGGTGPGNYTTIQSAIDASSPGDTVYVYNGTYFENVTIDKAINLIGEDRNTTTIDGGGAWDTVYLTAHWVNVTGFTLTNGSSSGIKLSYVNNCHIADNNASLNSGSGITLSRSRDNTIENNIALSNIQYGVYLFFSNNNILSGGNASANWWDGVGLMSSEHNTVRGTIAHRNRGNGIYLQSSKNNTIEQNMASANNGEGIYLFLSEDNDIVGNNLSSNKLDGIYIWSSSGNSLEANSVFRNGRYGIYLLDSGSSSIVNNVASRSLSGILLQSSSGSVVVGNDALSNVQHGIFLHSSGGSIIANNTVLSNDENGINLISSSDNSISNNTALTNVEYGLSLQYSSVNTVERNTLSENLRGAYLYYSFNNTISRNNISLSSEYGFFLEFSNNSTIHHNNIIDNLNQAYDIGNNSWDNGYPSGGNYWSDYTGLDQFSGPNQDVPGSDGIGDTPYIIDADSQDRYPLTVPLIIFPPRPPSTLDTHLSGSGSENVTLTWSLSPDDGQGLRSVIGYQIYRNSTYDSGGIGYGMIASLPNQMTEFVDVLAGEGDPSNYFYRVCAVDLYNNTTFAEGQAGKFTRPLAKGPNLVSLPLIQSDVSIEEVLQTVKYDKVWTYDSSGKEWKSHIAFKPYKGELKTINHRIGVWINVIMDCNLTVAGVIPTRTAIGLKVGWNLVGYPSMLKAYAVGDLKAETGAMKVEGYDSSTSPYFLRVLTDAVFLDMGVGYWVYVDSDTSWTVQNS